MFEEKSGLLMWREWRTTVWQKSPEIIVNRECAAEAGQKAEGKSQRNSLVQNSGRTGISLQRRLIREEEDLNLFAIN
jgi:hypothetical protein